jgi:hypothetical protein
LADLGEFDDSLENARVYSLGQIESSKIGAAKSDGATGRNQAGESHRRSYVLPYGAFGWMWSKEDVQRADLSTSEVEIRDYKWNGFCMTTVTFVAAAGYPFSPKRLTPNVDYSVTFAFRVSGENQVSVRIHGQHDTFPDYEAVVDGEAAYAYQTKWSGPLSLIFNGTHRFSNNFEVFAETAPCCSFSHR